jgi:hypothetical protein
MTWSGLWATTRAKENQLALARGDVGRPLGKDPRVSAREAGKRTRARARRGPLVPLPRREGVCARRMFSATVPENEENVPGGTGLSTAPAEGPKGEMSDGNAVPRICPRCTSQHRAIMVGYSSSYPAPVYPNDGHHLPEVRPLKEKILQNPVLVLVRERTIRDRTRFAAGPRAKDRGRSPSSSIRLAGSPAA